MDRNRIGLWVLSLGLCIAAGLDSTLGNGFLGLGGADASISPYNVALMGERRAELPLGERVGNFDLWYGGANQTLVETSASLSEQDILVRVAWSTQALSHEVELTLTDDGAAATDFFFGCFSISGPDQNMGGRAWLLTDGELAVLQFEIYTLYFGGGITPLVGQVQLGPLGVDLANLLADRAEQDGELEKLEPRRVEFSGKWGAPLISEGQVDGLGRRQGRWTVMDAGVLLLERDWKDGVVHGSEATYDEEHSLRTLESYQMGFLHGAAFNWVFGGMRTRNWDLGVRTDEGSWLHPNGVRAGETCREASGLVTRTWDRNGELIGESLEEALTNGWDHGEWKLGRQAHRREVLDLRAEHSY